ncbi:MAG: hypothetical protein ABEJ40_10510, partial [Haloarculaceae archaeon]
MDDAPALRRTIRRCTAVLVAAVALHMGAVAGYGNNWPAVLFVGAALYLLVSFFAQIGAATAPESDDRSAG